MRRAICVAALVAAAAPARAQNALDTFGFSSRSSGMAGANAADCDGYAGAHHNPASVARTSDVQAAVGYGYGVTRLQIDGSDAKVTTPRGFSFGLAVTIPVCPMMAAFGIALYIPDQYVARIQLIPVAEPHFILLDNNLQRIVVTPVLSLRPFRWLSIGAGATLLADAAGNGVSFDVGVVGGQKVGNASLDVGLPIRAAPVAGILVEPRPGLRAGLAWQGAIDLALKLDILAHVNIAGAVTGDTLISLRAFNFFTPERVTLGLAWDAHPSLTLSADLAWVHYSDFHGGVPDLRILVALGVTPSLVGALFPADGFHDIWVPRIGAEWRRPVTNLLKVMARAGYSYERSPVPDQVGLTSFADADRHIIAVGGGVELAHVGAVLTHPLKLDLAVQWQELQPRTTEKDPRFSPGAGFTASGRIVLLSTTVEARF